MTIPSTARKAGPLLGTGAQTAWPFTFKVFAAADIAVTIANSLGIETPLVLGTDYSVTLNVNQDTSPGGTVTYPISGTPLAVGSKLSIVGDIDYDQPLDLPSGGNFSPLALENELDRVVMQIQQLREVSERALLVPVTSGASPSLPAPEANQIIGWNPTATGLQNVPLAELATAVAFAAYRYNIFTGDGVTTTFVLDADPVTLGNLDVSVDGQTYVPGVDHTLVGTSLVFSVAPSNGAEILARYGQGLASGVSGDALDISYQPAGASAVATTVQAKLRETVSVKDFGAVGDGVTDDTSAIQAAATAAAGKQLTLISGTYKISASIVLLSNTSVLLEPGATVTTATTGISILLASGKTNVNVRGNGKLQYTAAGATGLIGAVEFSSCTNCAVDGIKISGGQFAGVLLNNSSNCTVTNNIFSATLGTHQDAADIVVYNNSNDNTILGNQCTGSGAHGVLVQGPGVTIPLRNRIIGNFINAKTTYGIAVYQATAADNYTLVQGNEITGILGTGLSGASGNGIYLQTCGGSVVANNIVKDCCLNTTSTTNSPACISISFDQTSGPGMQPVSVTGNVVNSSKWSGLIVSSARGNVSGNSVNFTDTANGYGIAVYDASNLSLIGNEVNVPTTVARAGIFINSTLARGIENINVVGNTVFGGNDAQIYSTKTASGTTISGSFSNNTLQSSGSAALGLALNNLLNAAVNGNYINSAYIGFYIQNSSNVRGAGNVSRSGSSYRFLSGGTCSNVYFDDSNDFDIATPSRIGNTVTGVAVEQRSNGSPGAGNWQVGDRVMQTVPVVGQPKGWRCTVAGNPGTWVSEGNL